MLSLILRLCQVRIKELLAKTYPDYAISKGLQFVNNERFRKILHSTYKHKRIDSVIFITRTALCYMIKRYRTVLTSLPILIEDNKWQTAKKATVSVCGLGWIPDGLAIWLFKLDLMSYYSAFGVLVVIGTILFERHNREENTLSTIVVAQAVDDIRR